MNKLKLEKLKNAKEYGWKGSLGLFVIAGLIPGIFIFFLLRGLFISININNAWGSVWIFFWVAVSSFWSQRVGREEMPFWHKVGMALFIATVITFIIYGYIIFDTRELY
ncbi:hypothetical protein HYV87_02680 [Candidatus Woesearchaeota archaeon]|nr:hypothetical protein [Candidatus Woesearchaeota archaeon]